MHREIPGPRSAFALFVITLVLNVGVSFALFAISQDLGLVLAEPLAIFLPTLMMVWMLGVDFGKTLRVRWPTGLDILVAIPLALALTVVNDQISNLTAEVLPMSEEMQEGIARLLRASTAYEWIIRLLGVGIGAAVSEELLFRGFIQKALEGRLGRSAAIFVASMLFAFMHFIPQGIPTYFVAGVVLGITAIATESVFVPILVHFIHNMSAVALLSLSNIETLGRPVWLPAGILVPGLILFAVTLGYFVRRMEAFREPFPFARPADAPLEQPPGALQGVAPGRRRLGWLTVGCAVAWGTAVVLGLFTYSIYRTHSELIRAMLIESMRQEVLSSLPSSTSPLASQVAEELDALAAVNRTGRLGLVDLGRLNWIFVVARSDGSLTSDEVLSFLEAVRSVVRARSAVRHL